MNFLLTICTFLCVILTIIMVIVFSREIKRLAKEKIEFYNSWVDGGYVPYDITYEGDLQ